MSVTASPGAGRVLVALADGPLVAEPTWTRYDMLGSDCRCYGYDATAGRQSELDITDTGTATVYFHDRNQTLDSDTLVGKQILLQLYNPVNATWYPRWRGHIDDVEHDLVDGPPDLPLANVALHCVDVFDYLGNCKMVPGTFGDVLPSSVDPNYKSIAGSIFYEDERVDDRVIALYTDAGLASSMYVTFTGNVYVNETLYGPEDVILQALRDAADAEFPGVANVYVDRFGRTVFHGREARFDPVGTADGANWIYQTFDAATREDVTAGVAQIRVFGYNRPRSRIINSFLAYPRADENGRTFKQKNIPALQREDLTSIGNYGRRSPLDAPDLIIKEEYAAAGGRTGAQLCGLFGDFYVDNYSSPRKAIQTVTFMAHRPDDPRADATWALMCSADISDTISLTVDEASLAAAPFFVDGYSVEVRVLNQDHDMVTFTPNLTPGSYYGTDVFAS